MEMAASWGVWERTERRDWPRTPPGQKLVVFLQFERKIQRGYRSMAKIVLFVVNNLAQNTKD